MASLYKKPIIVTDPRTGQKVKAVPENGGADSLTKTAPNAVVPLAADKLAAQAMLNDLVRKVELRIAGLESPFEKHLSRPLAEPPERLRR
jgi:hypothetical protein